MRWKSIEEARLARMGASSAQLQEPEPSRWSPDELGLIRYAYPAFKEMTTKPSLNQIVVEFLKRYEVYVTPAATSNRRTGGEVASGAFFGAISGATGNHEYAADAAIIRNQKSGTAIQEWTQWKQWALDHKDFEAFRAGKTASYDTLKKRLESDEFADEFNSNKSIFLARFREAEKSKNSQNNIAGRIIFGIAVLIIIFCSTVIFQSNQKRNSDPKSSSSLSSTTALTAS